MRSVFTIFLIFITTCTFAQHDDLESALVSYRPGTVLAHPNFDSLQFEFRYFTWGFGVGEAFLQISLDKKSKWNYRIGYWSYESGDIHITELNKRDIAWSIFWSKLDSIDIKNLPNQRDLKLVLTHKSGKKSIIDSEKYFETIMDGSSITIELINEDSAHVISYSNPDMYEKSLREHQLTGLSEHVRFNYAIEVINEYFDMKSPRISQLYERIDTTNIKKGNKKKKKKNGL